LCNKYSAGLVAPSGGKYGPSDVTLGTLAPINLKSRQSIFESVWDTQRVISFDIQ